MANGIKIIVVPGINLESSWEAIQLAEKYPGIYAAVGVHPNEAMSWSENHHQELLNLSKHPKVVAIGEIGLDYYRDYSPVDLQRIVFLKQLELSIKVTKPIIIHCRDAFTDLWQMLIKSDYLSGGANEYSRGVFHSFSGTIEQAQSVCEIGFKIGITGPITYKSGTDIQNIVTQIPLEHILVETDSPYLPPAPYRGKRNEPAFLIEIVNKLAYYKKLNYNEIEYQTTKNASELFGFGAHH